MQEIEEHRDCDEPIHAFHMRPPTRRPQAAGAGPAVSAHVIVTNCTSSTRKFPLRAEDFARIVAGGNPLCTVGARVYRTDFQRGQGKLCAARGGCAGSHHWIVDRASPEDDRLHARQHAVSDAVRARRSLLGRPPGHCRRRGRRHQRQSHLHRARGHPDARRRDDHARRARHRPTRSGSKPPSSSTRRRCCRSSSASSSWSIALALAATRMRAPSAPTRRRPRSRASTCSGSFPRWRSSSA